MAEKTAIKGPPTMTRPTIDEAVESLCTAIEAIELTSEHRDEEMRTAHDIGVECMRARVLDRLRSLPKQEPVEGWRDIATERAATIEECAKIVEPKWERPCDCERCDCGNTGDAEDVAWWDAMADAAKTIRALTPAPHPGEKT